MTPCLQVLALDRTPDAPAGGATHRQQLRKPPRPPRQQCHAGVSRLSTVLSTVVWVSLMRWAQQRCHPQAAAAVVAMLIGGLAPCAAAGDFSAAGTFAFDSAAQAQFDFEEGAPPPSDETDPPLVRAASDSALSGRWLLEVPAFGSASMVAALPPDKRSYRVSLWVRGADAVGLVVVSHGQDSRAAEVSTLYPSGRMTSDGWVELANHGIAIDGARSRAAVGVFSPSGAQLDAIEVVSERVLTEDINPPCAGATDGSACGEQQVCYWSECRNVRGWVPPLPQDRASTTQYLANRLRFLFGPFANRSQDLPAALTAIEGMRSATTPWRYWNSYLLAVRRLHDGHTRTSGLARFVIANPKPLNVCFLEGDADLSHAQAPSDAFYRDVLVSHVGPDHNLGLKAGDRIVAVDGLHPIAWSRALIEQSWSQPSISNHQTFAEHAARLRAAISRFAHHIEVIRCDPQTSVCGAPETISISDIPADPADATLDVYACDNRPLRHLPTAPANHNSPPGTVHSGIVDVSDSSERIYGLEWESLYTLDGNDGVGANLKQALNAIDSGGARGAIVDHRTGTGGTVLGPSIIWDWAVPKHPVTFTQARQRAQDEQPTAAQGLALFNAAKQSGQVVFGGSAAATTIPIALLVTQDVSASDWLPLGLKGQAPNVRIFGPYQTNGAFSTRFELSYWLGMTVVLASGDSFVPSGYTQAGYGVAPDVVVLPKQSDLLVGEDTVFNAAVAWVRQEMQP